MNVLIAEDDTTSRAILKAVLSKWGYSVTAVDNGLSVLEILEKPQPPRLLILDWNMPVMDGLEVCQRIRTLYPLAPFYIIMLTARAEKSHMVTGLDAGANDYIAKPYDNDEIRARINVGRRMIEVQEELERAKDAILHEATHDALTGVLNRRAILNRLDKICLSAGPGGDFPCIAMMDIDHFKKINDRYGHQTGDDVLIGFARIVQAHLGEQDLFGRYGGEEFLAIVRSPGPEPMRSLLEGVKEAVAGGPIETRSGDVPVTVSIGMAGPVPGKTVDELLAAADRALYKAKDMGRNRVIWEN